MKHSETNNRRPDVFNDVSPSKLSHEAHQTAKGEGGDFSPRVCGWHLSYHQFFLFSLLFSSQQFQTPRAPRNTQGNHQPARRMADRGVWKWTKTVKPYRILMSYPYPSPISVKWKIRIVFIRQLWLSSLYLLGVVLDMPESSGDYEMLAFQYKITHLSRELALALCQGQTTYKRMHYHLAPLAIGPNSISFPPTSWFLLPYCGFFLNVWHLLNI